MAAINNRGSRLSSRPFYTTLLLISLLASYSFLAHPRQSDAGPASLLAKRSESPECADVHQAEDQCSFVRQYCIDDDAGLLSYIDFYYCGLGSVQPIAFVVLVVWLGLLFTTIGIAASDFFSVNLSTIATILGLSESLAGVTFLAFGNGSPDVFSTFAAMGSNSASMAVGELIGAASFITGVVAGSMALVREFRVDRRTYARDICFFIIAVCFTMVFLADGHLHLWECCAMIGYYIVYVVTVVVWHWYIKRRKQRLRREGESRSHVFTRSSLGGADDLAGEPYRDDPDDTEHPQTGADITSLENGPRIEIDSEEMESGDGDSSEDHERMVAAEVASSMRVLRTSRKRSSTMVPHRASLVGALEFRSALSHLQRESNLKLSDIQGRSHLDDHAPGGGRERATSAVGPGAHMSRQTIEGPREATIRRDRALSSGDATGSISVTASVPSYDHRNDGSRLGPDKQPKTGEGNASPIPSYTVGGNLAPPPTTGSLGPSVVSPNTEGPVDMSPKLHLEIPSRRSSQSDFTSSPGTPFPRYSDSPMPTTPFAYAERGDYNFPRPSRRESPFRDLQTAVEEPRPVGWWPYSILPPPHILLATLFPTLQGWKEKSPWDKFVSAISVPSIFLLVITLPVVESESTAGGSLAETYMNYPSTPGNRTPGVQPTAPPVSIEPDSIEPESEWQRYRRHTLSRSSSRSEVPLASGSRLALPNDDTLIETHGSTVQSLNGGIAGKAGPEAPSISNANDETMSWNRWLVCLQLFTGPLFAVFILWANMLDDWDDPGQVLVRMVLYTLLGSLILLGVLVVFTSDQRRPKHHYLLCFLGFVISIAWISTIAGEVVGVLKALGVILGISESLLGLTIFAAGNSVGDLVADITVARLGYPVMALSACFGGPMLNILLGIGIGGVLMMVQRADHKHDKHPDRPFKYGPYRVQVSGTLMISAITLLVILVGMLIVVPMNKWVLSRRIGWGLIGIWVVSTIVNVVVELTGVWGELA